MSAVFPAWECVVEYEPVECGRRARGLGGWV
jgi:hypothetical protein